MTSQKIAIGLVAVALFVGSMTAHAAEFGAGVKAYNRGDYATALRIFRQLADQGDADAQYNLGVIGIPLYPDINSQPHTWQQNPTSRIRLANSVISSCLLIHSYSQG